MSNNQSDINLQQYASQPSQQVSYQYQVQKQNPLYKPPPQPVQTKPMLKQPIFHQKKGDSIQQAVITESPPDQRSNFQKRESLPKNFQYRVTSVDNKENLTNMQQGGQPHQVIHVRERSFERYPQIPSGNIVPVQQQIPLPVNQIPNTVPTSTQNVNAVNQQNQQNQSHNASFNYTNQQQNKQLFQQQYYSSNSSISTQPKTSTTQGQFSPIPSSHKQSIQQQPQVQQQQQPQQQQQQQQTQQHQNPPQIQQQQQVVAQQMPQSGQININLIQDIVKAEIKAALQNFKQEEKLENVSQRIHQFEEKWDTQSLKQLIHVENTQTSNEIYQLISELKDDFGKKLTKLSDQIHLNSESCKSNAYAVSQVQEKIMSFSKEYAEVTNKQNDDKKQIQSQFQSLDERYNSLAINLAKQVSDLETKMKKLLVDEAVKIDKQIKLLIQDVNVSSLKRTSSQPQEQLNSSPQQINKSNHQHNKSYDSLAQIPQNSNRSTNSSFNQNTNETAPIPRDSVKVEGEQNQYVHNVQLTRNSTSSQSQQQLPPPSPSYQQEQYNYSNRNSTQFSRRSHTELNTSSTSQQNVALTSPQISAQTNKDMEDFNKEIENYLKNRKVPAKIQELMNQSIEMKYSNISDQSYSSIGQQMQLPQTNSSLVSPRSGIANKPLIPNSPNISVVSPPQADKLQPQQMNDPFIKQQIQQYQPNLQKPTNINVQQIQQQDLKRINYQSLQQNRKAFEDYSGTSINSSTQISPSRIEQINLDMDSFNNEIQFSNNKIDHHNIGTHQHLQKLSDNTSPQKQNENMKFSIVRSSQKNPQLSMISEQDNEEEELIYQLDDNGFLMDENGNYVLDDKGHQVKLSGEQIEYLRNQNILEE